MSKDVPIPWPNYLVDPDTGDKYTVVTKTAFRGAGGSEPPPGHLLVYIVKLENDNV